MRTTKRRRRSSRRRRAGDCAKLPLHGGRSQVPLHIRSRSQGALTVPAALRCPAPSLSQVPSLLCPHRGPRCSPSPRGRHRCSRPRGEDSSRGENDDAMTQRRRCDGATTATRRRRRDEAATTARGPHCSPSLAAVAAARGSLAAQSLQPQEPSRRQAASQELLPSLELLTQEDG